MSDQPDPQAPERLARFVAGRNVGCPSCSYNLRDLQTGVCPECGAPLDLRAILAADPGFRSRRARVLVLAGSLLLLTALVLVVSSLTVRKSFPSGAFAFGPLIAVVTVIGTAIVLGFDAAVHAERLRNPRAKSLTSFAGAVHAWSVLLGVLILGELAALGWLIL